MDQKNKNKRLNFSKPDDILFGFLIAVALAFALFCYSAPKRINTDFPQVIAKKSSNSFKKKIDQMVKGFPIEQMSPYIARKDERVGSFLVAIAKKESNWGRHTPKKNGRECFNLWGYRGKENPTASGYSCFDSPEQAVNVVGGRINKLITQNIDTPREMVMWKCGSPCSGSAAQGANKWVRDVGLYYNKLYE